LPRRRYAPENCRGGVRLLTLPSFACSRAAELLTEAALEAAVSALFEPDYPAEPLVKTSPLTSCCLLAVLGAVRLVDACFLRRIDETEDAAACHFIERLFDYLTLRCSLRVNPLYRRRSLAAPVAVRYACFVAVPGFFVIEIQAYYPPPTSYRRNELTYDTFVDSRLTGSQLSLCLSFFDEYYGIDVLACTSCSPRLLCEIDHAVRYIDVKSEDDAREVYARP
jgi:hypothetical protein